MPISKLPDTLINQIAAGEVVEGPSAALKELVENSLDAGADKIDISLDNWGYARLSIQDNGTGIPKEEMILALTQHATSKLPDEDLMAIHAFGFRGEALAALASVSHLTLTSRCQGQTLAFTLDADTSTFTPAKEAVGTHIVATDLFYKTPARLKFAKSARAVRTELKTLLTRYALAHPKLSLTAQNDSRSFLEVTPCTGSAETERLKARLIQLFPDLDVETLLSLNAQESDYRLTGFIAPATQNYATRAYQHIFVRGRPVRDKLINTAIALAYQDVLPHGRFPFCVLFLDLPLDKVDVNVHPAKEEVRFSETRFLKNWLIHTLKTPLHGVLHSDTRLLSKHSMVEGFLGRDDRKTTAYPGIREDFEGGSDDKSTRQTKFGTKSTVPSQNQPAAESLAPVSTQNISYIAHAPKVMHAVREPAFHYSVPLPQPKEAVQPEHDAPHISQPALKAVTSRLLGHALGQIHASFIVAENDDGLVIVDQHAAHERLVYEEMKRTCRNHTAEALLIPVQLTLAPEIVEALNATQKTLKTWGFHLEPQSATRMALYSVPAPFKDQDVSTLLKDLGTRLANALQQEKKGSDAHTHDTEFIEEVLGRALHVLLGNKACKNSIKANHRLTLEEMNALLRRMEETPKAGQCNHGRPTYITFSRAELEKRFCRT